MIGIFVFATIWFLVMGGLMLQIGKTIGDCRL